MAGMPKRRAKRAGRRNPKHVDYRAPLYGADGQTIKKCCSRVTGYVAKPSVRVDTMERGYALESEGCDCPSRWIPFDWKKGHAEFVRRNPYPAGTRVRYRWPFARGRDGPLYAESEGRVVRAPAHYRRPSVPASLIVTKRSKHAGPRGTRISGAHWEADHDIVRVGRRRNPASYVTRAGRLITSALAPVCREAARDQGIRFDVDHVYEQGGRQVYVLDGVAMRPGDAADRLGVTFPARENPRTASGRKVYIVKKKAGGWATFFQPSFPAARAYAKRVSEGFWIPSTARAATAAEWARIKRGLQP